MDVIDRYLRTLQILLPKDQRDDIIRELSEEMREQIADHERTAGRPLTVEEKGAIVGQFGHPLVTAARYRPQRHLIGPIVFPYYWLALKVMLGLVVGGHFAGGLILLGSGASFSELGSHLNGAVANILKVAGWMTALAAWFDLWLSRSNVLKNWRPDLSSPPSRLAGHAVASALSGLPGSHSHRSSPTSPAPSASGLVLATIVSVWWLAGLRWPALFFGSGAAHLDWGPAMGRLYPILVVAQLTMLVEQFVRLRAREAAVILGLTQVVWLVAGWSLIYVVATSDHHWMIWRGAGASSTTAMRIAGREILVLDFVNYVWSTIFVFVAVMCAWSSLKGITRRLRRTPRPAHA